MKRCKLISRATIFALTVPFFFCLILGDKSKAVFLGDNKSDKIEKELARFQGTWILAKSLNRGTNFLPDKEVIIKIRETTMEYYLDDKKVHTTGFLIDPSKMPAAIDIIGKTKDKKMKMVRFGIYAFEGDRLKIATKFSERESNIRPNSFEPKSKLLIQILKRTK